MIYQPTEALEPTILQISTNLEQVIVPFVGTTYRTAPNEFLIEKIMSRKTTPAAYRIPTVTVLFNNITRTCLARLTRDTAAAINSESGAVSKMENGKLLSVYSEPNFRMPPVVANNPELEGAWIQHVQAAVNLYHASAGTMWTADARQILPQCQTLSIAFTYTAEQLAKVMKKRIMNSVGDEDNYVIRCVRDQILNYAFENEFDRAYWHFVVKSMGVESVEFVDEFFGNQMTANPNVRGDVGTTPLYRKEQGSMYYYLIELYKQGRYNALKTGEIEMIKSWLEA